MKFRKKTMATLFAAVLIAIAGVMTALATPTDPVPLEVSVRGIVSIQITFVDTVPFDPVTSVVDFGELSPDETSDPHTITIQNNGEYAVVVSSEVTQGNLPGTVIVTDIVGSLAIGSSDDASLTITIDTLASIGDYAGSILFTAIEG